MNISKFKYFIREILKDHFTFYQNYLITKSRFFNHFIEFKKQNLGYDKIELTLNHSLLKKKINPKKHFFYLKNLKVTKNGYHSINYNAIKDNLPSDPKNRSELLKKNKISVNPNYFDYLNSFGIRGIIFDKIYTRKIRKSYFLLPSNIVFLELISRLDFSKINGFVFDIGTGLGNFLGYLNLYLDKNKIIGIDNFSLISLNSINCYQKQTFNFKVTSRYSFKNNFLWTLGGLPISYIIKEIEKHQPQYIMFEFYYHQEVELLNNYSVDFFNEIIIVVKMKHIKSLKTFF